MHRDYHIGGKLLQLRDCVLDIIRWCDAQVEAAEHGVQLVGAMNTAMAEGMIIAQRRPRRSPIQPQKLVAKKARRLKSRTGVDANSRRARAGGPMVRRLSGGASRIRT
jgi:hypothetical protein